MTAEIQVGDVALDLTQGRPVHVLEDTGQTASEWSEANDYDLCGNYGNSRLNTQATDQVYDVVYCSNAKSKPSKTYAMPESRLLRVETEAADDGRQVYDRVAIDVLEQLYAMAMELDENWSAEPEGWEDALGKLVANIDGIESELTSEARELAEVDHRIPLDENEDEGEDDDEGL